MSNRKFMFFFLIMFMIMHITAIEARETNMDNTTANNQTQKGVLLRDLFKILEKYSNEHNLTTEQTYMLFNELMTTTPSLPHGGLGNINGDMFVITKGTKNKMILKDNEWTGKDYQEQELVIINGSKILTSVPLEPDFTNRTLNFVLFKPDVIYFFNWDTFGGGFYKRSTTLSRGDKGVSP